MHLFPLCLTVLAPTEARDTPLSERDETNTVLSSTSKELLRKKDPDYLILRLVEGGGSNIILFIFIYLNTRRSERRGRAGHLWRQLSGESAPLSEPVCRSVGVCWLGSVYGRLKSSWIILNSERTNICSSSRNLYAPQVRHAEHYLTKTYREIPVLTVVVSLSWCVSIVAPL